MVGNSNKGMTFILQQFTPNSQLHNGYNIKIENLNLEYETIDEQNVILLDSAGFEDP